MDNIKFRTELHAHTSVVSRCAQKTPAETAELYIAAGYSSIVLTNHYVAYNFPDEKTWEENIESYLAPIYEMREYAKGRLNVLAGAEIHNFQNSNDYLIYGIDEDFLRTHKNLHLLKVSEISELVRASGALMVQAHPFRNAMTIVNPTLLDGMEVYNGTPTPAHEARLDVANLWAKRYGLIRTSGSDYHGHIYPDSPVATGGILTDEPITSPEQLLRTLRSGCYDLICEGPVADRYGMKTMPAKED
jgi:hypothetical protein